jgi:hypothetical protein
MALARPGRRSARPRARLDDVEGRRADPDSRHVMPPLAQIGARRDTDRPVPGRNRRPPADAATESRMQPSISLVTLGVADLARSRAFYADGLGWRPAFETGEVVFFQMAGCVFGLFAREQLEADMRRPCPGTGAFSLAHNVAGRGEVDEVMATAKAAGAVILKPPEDALWGGYSGYFADPDGHAWEVAWNPGWRFDDNGIMRIGG